MSEDIFEPYQPAKFHIEGAKKHPTALVESSAMASVDPPDINYNLSLPQSVITKGQLSDIQLENVAYAGMAFEGTVRLADGTEVRRGYLIGDGTGVGKGREISGIILDQMRKGRTKAIWVSKNEKLFADAQRDWSALGQDKKRLFNLGAIKAGTEVQASDGIMYVTYGKLRSVAKSTKQRTIDQIIAWVGKDFDGVMVFDEAHHMGNAIAVRGQRGTKKPSQTAILAAELRNLLPQARVVYVSATAATEVINLAYAERLGLWGPGTPFPSVSAFVSDIGSGGVNAMEQVARDMKALGVFSSRSLSFNDGTEEGTVRFGTLEHKLTAEQRGVYDKVAQAWQIVLRNINQAIQATGMSGNGMARGQAMSQFWGANQRFFNQIITAMKVPSMVRAVEKDLAEGRSAVIQLTSTYESAQNRALAEREKDTDLEDFDLTPVEILMQYVDNGFPTQQYETYIDENGNERARPVLDSQGRPVQNREAVAMKERLLDQLGAIRNIVPESPLDTIINHFGANTVAEATGRSRRVVRKNGKRVVERRGKHANQSETDAFMGGKKRVLIFSEAGGTGASYHADMGEKNQQRRAHYVLQPGWRADVCLQGMGRSHRSNQRVAPWYQMVSTDLQGEKRFNSTICRRLNQVGALQFGERKAGSAGLFSASDNLESPEALDALHTFFNDLVRGRLPVDISLADYQEQTGLKLVTEQGSVASDLPDIRQFLNRLLNLEIDFQNEVFNAFQTIHQEKVEQAQAEGTLDIGVENYKADQVKEEERQTVYTHSTGGKTEYIRVTSRYRVTPITWDNLQRSWKPNLYVKSSHGKTYGVAEASSRRDARTGQTTTRYRLIDQSGSRFIDRVHIDHDYKKQWEELSRTEAKAQWDKDVEALPEFKEREEHFISGLMLPIWDRLRGDARLHRVLTTGGDVFIGRKIPNTQIRATLASLGVEAGRPKISPESAVKSLLGGQIKLELSNGWRLKYARVGGEARIELVGPEYEHQTELREHGVFSERIGYTTRWFLPSGEQSQAVYESLTKQHHVVTVEYLSGDDPTIGGSSGAGGSMAAAQVAGGYGPVAFSEKAAVATNRRKMRAAVDQELKKHSPSITNDFLSLTSPAHVSDVSRRGGRYLRMSIAELAQKDVASASAYAGLHHAFQWMGKEDIVAFIDRIESGQKDPDPKLERIASIMRKQLDGRRDYIRKYGKHWLQHFYENYFPHIWRDPSQVETWVRGWFGKRPLSGRKSFLKKRTLPTFKEGIEVGLQPESWNPVDLVLLKLHEMDKFIMFQDLLARGRNAGIFRFKYVKSQMPDGHARINDYAFKVIMPPEMKVKEAYDGIMVDQLMALAKGLGIDTGRFMKIGGRRWGYATWSEGIGEDYKVRTKFGGPESTLVHEIGHILGAKYHLYDLLRRKGEGSTRPVTRGKHKGEMKFEPTQEAVDHRKVIDVEWRALADLRFEGQKTTPGFKRYVRKGVEKEAVLLEALIHAPDKFQETAPHLYEHFTTFLGEQSELSGLLDIKSSLVLGETSGTMKIPGVTELGEWTAPKDIARLINNYLSPGLRSNENRLVANSYNLTRQTGNLMNMAQLSLSGFHALNITTDMWASVFGLGVRQLGVSGQRLQGLGNMVAFPTAPIRAVWSGIRLRRAYKQQMDTIQDPKLRRLVELTVAAGGRESMDPVYYNQSWKRIGRALDTFRHDPVLRKMQAALELPFDMLGAIAETVSWPLMQWYVPTGKLGLFSIMAAHEMQRAEADQIDTEQLWERLTQSWDSVDNRMGQLVYDNLFWNKTLKDILMLAVRSVGWNLGSWREYGGIPVDILGTKGRLRRGDVWMSQKMAYGMGAVVVYGIIGAIVMYVLTGKRPDELKDYFFPKTGRKDANGQDERLSFPTYAKDWFAYADDPVRTVSHKLHPMWSALFDLMRNQDFFGTEIRNSDDPVLQQITDMAQYIGKQFTPITVQNYMRMQRVENAPTSNLTVSLTGIQSAPKYITRTPAQKLMYRIIADQIPDTPRTEEEKERGDYRRQFISKLRKGEPVNHKEAKDTLGVDRYKQAVSDGKLPPFQVSFKRLSFDDALDVYALTNTKERAMLGDALTTKFANSRTLSTEAMNEFLPTLSPSDLLAVLATTTYSQDGTRADNTKYAKGEAKQGQEEKVKALRAEYQKREGKAPDSVELERIREEQSRQRSKESLEKKFPNMSDQDLIDDVAAKVGSYDFKSTSRYRGGKPHKGMEDQVKMLKDEYRRRTGKDMDNGSIEKARVESTLARRRKQLGG